MKKEAERQAYSVIFEGMTSFRAVIRSSVPDARKITRLMFDRAKERSKTRELSFIRRMSAERGFEVVMCGADEINALATGTSHGGIIFECTERTIPTLCAGNIVGRDDGISDFFIMLDGIEDPYNFGYALRSVYAAGAAGVILPGRNWMSAAGVGIMFTWIADNIVTIAICAVLVAIVAAIIVSLIRDKKKGKSTCGCNCAHCAMHGSCHKS